MIEVAEPPRPEAGQFWEVTAGTGLGHVIEIVRVEVSRDPINRPFAIVRPLGGLAAEDARLPLDERWATGMRQIHACPVCDQPLPGPHLGTCRYSMMHTGKPELQSRVPPEHPSADVASQEASSLADRIRMFANMADAYRATDPDPDEQIIATAAEIDSNMTYLGGDDAILEIAAEVAKLEQRDRVRMADIVAQVEVEKGGKYILWRCPECHAQVLCTYEGEDMGQVRMQQFCPHVFDQAEMKIVSAATVDGNGDEMMMRLADAWAYLQSAPRDVSDIDAEVDISTVENILKGDPGHQEPEEFQARRRAHLEEHGPRLGWGASQITVIEEG